MMRADKGITMGEKQNWIGSFTQELQKAGRFQPVHDLSLVSTGAKYLLMFSCCIIHSLHPSLLIISSELVSCDYYHIHVLRGARGRFVRTLSLDSVPSWCLGILI